MEFRGRIYKVMPVKSGKSEAGNEWRKQEFIFEYFENKDQRWSDKVVLSAMNGRIEEYDLREGDEVTIGFDHRVREWNGKWLTEFHIYKFEKHMASPYVAQPAEQPTQAPQRDVPPPTEGEDDLPF